MNLISVGTKMIPVDSTPTVLLTSVTNALLLKGFSPYIGENGNWFVYDSKVMRFVDTGISAKSSVLSVNGKTGAVALTANDVGALPVGYHDDSKQDSISDLDVIRAGASAGATALQAVPSTYRTAAEQDTIDRQKQPVITDLAAIRAGAASGATALQKVPDTYRKAQDQDDIDNGLSQRIDAIEAAEFPNAVFIGEPLIVGSTVSRFTNADYMIFPFMVDVRNKPFSIEFAFHTGADVNTQQNILDSRFGMALAIQNGRGIMALSSNGVSWDIGLVTGTMAILPNANYYAKIAWDGSAYTGSLSTDGETYTADMYAASTAGLFPQTMYIGGAPDLFGAGSAHPFGGGVDMAHSRLIVAGLEVWHGMDDPGLASRANVSLSNLDALGLEKFKAENLPYGDRNVAEALASIPTKLSQLSGDATHRVVTDAEKTAWSEAIAPNTLNADDLDSVTASGVYYVSSSKAQTVGNIPAKAWGVLVVSYGKEVKNNVLQEYYTASSVFYRIKTSSGFGAWVELQKKITLEASISDNASAIPSAKAVFDWFHGADGAIPGVVTVRNVDFDTLVKTGVYGATGANQPGTGWHVVFVMSYAYDRISQLAWAMGGGCWSRIRNGGGWTKWIQIDTIPDSTPTAGSTNPVTSGGVAAALPFTHMDLLWENSSPGNNFLPQSISVPEYGMYIILVRGYTGTAKVKANILLNNSDSVVEYNWTNDSGNYGSIRRRNVRISGGVIEFNNAIVWDEVADGVGRIRVLNDTVIPTHIYGVKTVINDLTGG